MRNLKILCICCVGDLLHLAWMYVIYSVTSCNSHVEGPYGCALALSHLATTGP